MRRRGALPRLVVRTRGFFGASITAGLPLSMVLSTVLSVSASAATVLRLPPSYRSWTLSPGDSDTDLRISQISIPFTASIPLGGAADLVLSGSSAFATADADTGSTESLNGAGDLKAQVFVRFLRDRVLLQAGVNAPTGKKELSPEEFAVSSLLSHPLLGFRLKRYGEGLDLNGGAALAVPLAGGIDFGLGGGFTSHGKYTLLEDGDDYTPGEEISLSAGLDFHGSGSEGRPGPSLRLDGSFRAFGADAYTGQDIFEQGNQTELSAEASLGSSGPRALLSVRGVLQDDNQSFTTTGETVATIRSQSGTALYVLGGFDLPVAGSMRLGLDGEWTRFDGSDVPGYEGNAFGGGPVLRAALGESGSLSLGGRYLIGTIPAEDDGADIDLTGFHVTAALQWRGGQ